MSAVNTVVLALGSNLGDRVTNLQSALDVLIESQVLSHVVASSIYETEPVGGPEQGQYLNAVIRGNTPLTPTALLQEAHRIEDQLGRVRTVHWGPRTLDIDILAYGNLELNSADLVIPHPRAHERAFVLLPWSEIDSHYEISTHGTVEKCLSAVSLDGVVPVVGAELHLKAGGI